MTDEELRFECVLIASKLILEDTSVGPLIGTAQRLYEFIKGEHA